MSLIEDQNRENNLRTKEDSKNAWVEHLAEMERNRIANERCTDPKLVAFKKRREEQALRHRKSSSW